jgi:hypothetical protein
VKRLDNVLEWMDWVVRRPYRRRILMRRPIHVLRTFWRWSRVSAPSRMTPKRSDMNTDRITKADIGRFTFAEYEKVGRTKLSHEVLPVGTKVETFEGEYTCAEPSRLALDVNGNVYPVAESVFKQSYRLAVA